MGVSEEGMATKPCDNLRLQLPGAPGTRAETDWVGSRPGVYTNNGFSVSVLPGTRYLE